ncbi:hypothetical protein [Sporolactobacillus sp. KGMB 08714]|uniref:hypothetical protein n=1 Tax=Sporolactobacillus sp. KGMB 08714 TaxID=3064704 RepID=UPI002FBEB81C
MAPDPKKSGLLPITGFSADLAGSDQAHRGRCEGSQRHPAVPTRGCPLLLPVLKDPRQVFEALYKQHPPESPLPVLLNKRHFA